MTDFKVNNNEGDQLNSFVLYSTSACHLCEDALLILNELHEQMLELAKETDFLLSADLVYAVKIVDIAEDDKLIEVYGPRIPVLIFLSSGEELAWPFDIQTAYQFILPKLSFPAQ
tara:strand:- start:1610 stop:1954 length:345 start_codon:yes stop_codon:yes gene_type:complete